MSGYIFDCELVEEYLRQGWTTTDALKPIIEEYNRDITDLRRSEYRNRAILARYWNKDRRKEFIDLMREIRTIDSAVHELNDQYEKVNVLKTEEKVDPARAKSNAAHLDTLLNSFRPDAEQLLDKLE